MHVDSMQVLHQHIYILKSALAPAFLHRVSHRYFMQQAARHKASAHAVAFLRAMPEQHLTIHAYTLALTVCAAAQDVQTARTVVEIAANNSLPHDTILMTALIGGEHAEACIHGRCV